MSTVSETKEHADKSRSWLVIDAQDKTLGRLASGIAPLLRGKHKVGFTPHVDMGDYVIVINASQIRLTGNKLENKIYKYHTGYVGGIKEVPAGKMLQKNPGKVIRMAIWGMLPKGPLGRHMIKKLKVFSGAEHDHAAQKIQDFKPQYI